MKILIVILSIILTFDVEAAVLPNSFGVQDFSELLNFSKNTELRRGRSFGGSRRSFTRRSRPSRKSSSSKKTKLRWKKNVSFSSKKEILNS